MSRWVIVTRRWSPIPTCRCRSYSTHRSWLACDCRASGWSFSPNAWLNWPMAATSRSRSVIPPSCCKVGRWPPRSRPCPDGRHAPPHTTGRGAPMALAPPTRFRNAQQLHELGESGRYLTATARHDRAATTPLSHAPALQEDRQASVRHVPVARCEGCARTDRRGEPESPSTAW